MLTKCFLTGLTLCIVTASYTWADIEDAEQDKSSSVSRAQAKYAAAVKNCDALTADQRGDCIERAEEELNQATRRRDASAAEKFERVEAEDSPDDSAPMPTGGDDWPP